MTNVLGGQSGWASISKRRLRSLPVNVAIAAAIRAVPYIQFVVRMPVGVMRRATLGGVAYALHVTAGTMVTGVMTGENRIQPSIVAPLWLIGQIGIAWTLTLPVTVVGGLVGGWVYGALTTWLTHRSGNAPIVA